MRIVFFFSSCFSRAGLRCTEREEIKRFYADWWGMKCSWSTWCRNVESVDLWDRRGLSAAPLDSRRLWLGFIQSDRKWETIINHSLCLGCVKRWLESPLWRSVCNFATSARLGVRSRCHMTDWLQRHARELACYRGARQTCLLASRKGSDWNLFTPAPLLQENARHPAAEKWGHFTPLPPVRFMLVACTSCLQHQPGLC